MPAKKIKMIFLDMDGTLLNNDAVVSAGNEAVLNKLLHKGYKIAIATGRNYYEARKLTEKIPALAYITTNGSSIIDYDNKLIFNKPLQKENVRLLLELINQFSALTYALFTREEIITKDKNKYLDLLISFFSQKLLRKDGLQTLDHEIIKKELIKREVMQLREESKLEQYIETKQLLVEKFFVVGDNETLINLKESIASILGNRVKLSSSGKNNLEINSAGVSKGKSAAILAEKYHIPLKEIIAFGDSQNDLELFDIAGLSVAMGNSSDEILKEKADIIAADNEQDGVAQVLNNLLLNDN